jgi:anti-sigma regulatory factor (Ser/Thr protein kinase)
VDDVRFELQATTDEVPRARAQVRDSLAGLGADEIDRILLLASEVITGAVLHAGNTVVVDVIREDETVRVEVEGQPAAVAGPRLLSSMGDGLALDIVNHEASRWGVRPGAADALWFEVDLTFSDGDGSRPLAEH